MNDMRFICNCFSWQVSCFLMVTSLRDIPLTSDTRTPSDSAHE